MEDVSVDKGPLLCVFLDKGIRICSITEGATFEYCNFVGLEAQAADWIIFVRLLMTI